MDKEDGSEVLSTKSGVLVDKEDGSEVLSTKSGVLVDRGAKRDTLERMSLFLEFDSMQLSYHSLFFHVPSHCLSYVPPPYSWNVLSSLKYPDMRPHLSA